MTKIIISFLWVSIANIDAFRPDETVCVMTRDNVCLSTSIYYGSKGQKPWSCVYRTTPYGKETLDPTQWNDAGFCYIAQDWRGMGGSNGSYSIARSNGNDTVDTIKWLKQPAQARFSNGLLGVTGVSADAVAQYVSIGGGVVNDLSNYNTNIALLNQIKIGYLLWAAPILKEWTYQDGAYRESLIDGYFRDIGEPQSIVELQRNEEFNPWWYPIAGNFTEWDPKNHSNEPEWSMFNHSIINSAGWYDIFSTIQIKSALAINTTGQIGARGNQVLIVNPGGHCDGGAIKWPNASFGDDTMNTLGPIAFDGAFKAAQSNMHFNIHQYIPWNVLFYVLGPGERDTDGLYWVTAKSFPPYQELYGYLDGSGGNDNGYLNPDGAPTKSGSNSYSFDPTDPVTTNGGNNLEISPCGPNSQKPNEDGRKDILHYTSDVLDDNIAVVGLICVELFVGSDAVDTDFTAKVIDIFPNGTPMLVQDGILRMRWRNGPYSTSVAPQMKKGEVYAVTIDIGYMAYIFNVGHTISLSISSSNSPRFSVNMNNGNMVIQGNVDPVVANNVVYYGRDHPSRLILPQVDLQWLHQRKVKL